MCGLFWGAHKSLAPRARTLLGGLGQATLSFFAVATLLFVFFGECPIFCDLAKQRRKIVGGVSEVGKDDFSLYFCWRCVFFSLFYFSSAAIARLAELVNANPLWLRGGAGVGTRHQPHSARSFELPLCAMGVAPGRPGGGASCLGVGRPVSGALPTPTARPLGGLPGPTTHWLWVRGGAGVGTRHQPHSALSCELALRAVGAA